jgi:hypothetical protein
MTTLKKGVNRMYCKQFINVPVFYKHNAGQHRQQVADFNLTGQIRRADKVPYNVGSDIPELNISVKSARFTLMSGKLCKAQDFDGIVNQYFAEVHSTEWLYVTEDLKGYFMNAEEFKSLLYQFCDLERESNSTIYKIRMGRENEEVTNWLQAQL